MVTSSNGIETLKQFEGCVLHSYKPVPTEELYTIGYGHYGSKANEIITQEEAEQLLKNDLKIVEFGINNLVKVPINQNQFDALVSFSFNVGFSALRNSTLLKKLNANDFEGASNEFDKWIHAGNKVLAGLVERRKTEKQLFLKPVPQPKPKTIITPKYYTIKRGDKLENIAEANKTTISRILKLNPSIINPDKIYAGQKIKIKG